MQLITNKNPNSTFTSACSTGSQNYHSHSGISNVHIIGHPKGNNYENKNILTVTLLNSENFHALSETIFTYSLTTTLNLAMTEF